MMIANIGETVHAFVAADCDARSGGDFGHAREIFRGDGLFEKIERRVRDCTYVLKSLRHAPVLIGVSGYQHATAQRRADRPRALDVVLHFAGADFDLVSDVTFGSATLRFRNIGGRVARRDHAQGGNAATPFAAEQFVNRYAERFSQRVARGHFNRGFGAGVTIEVRVHRRRNRCNIERCPFEKWHEVLNRRYHALDEFAGHRRR
jgi:hypothetical protein